MPLYDYRCGSCGDFRAFAPMRESTGSRLCPVCGALSERMISAPFLAGADCGRPAAPQRHGGGVFGSRHVCGQGCSH